MSSPIKKYTLDDDIENTEGYTIGIITSLPSFTLCWHINKLLSINFIKVKDLELNLKPVKKKPELPSLFAGTEDEIFDEKNENTSFHSAYKYSNESLFANYYLIANKGSKTVLWAEMKKINYFFTIDCIPNEIKVDELIFQLNNIESVEIAFEAGNYCMIDKLQLAV